MSFESLWGQVFANNIAVKQSEDNLQRVKDQIKQDEIDSLQRSKQKAERDIEESEDLRSRMNGVNGALRKELALTKEKLKEAENATLANALASDEAFQELMMDIYGTDTNKEEKVKKDLLKFKRRTQQIAEEKIKSLYEPKKFHYTDVNLYIEFPNVGKTQPILDKVMALHESISFWKAKGYEPYANIVLKTEEEFNDYKSKIKPDTYAAFQAAKELANKK